MYSEYTIYTLHTQHATNVTTIQYQVESAPLTTENNLKKPPKTKHKQNNIKL